MSRQPGTPSLLRAINDRAALDLLLRHAPLTRVDLGKHTGLSKVTASQLLARLYERGLVTVVGTRSTGRGPSAELYALRAGCTHGVGIELGPTTVTAELADVTGTVLARVERAVDGSTDPERLIRDTTLAVAASGDVAIADVGAVVIGTPGVVDPGTGDIAVSFDLPGWRGGLREALASGLGCGVTFENDVNLAGIAERVEGAGRDVDDMVLLWVGRGVGVAVVLGGRLHRGATGAAGEVGYLPMPGVQSPANVEQPGRGALQGLVGATAVLALAEEHGIRAADATDAAGAVRAALAGGRATDGFVHTLVERLALGVASVCAVVDPALVVLAGDVGAAGGDRLCALVARAVRRIAPVHPQVVPTDVAAEPVLRGAVLGAVEQARDELFAGTQRRAGAWSERLT